MNNNDNNDDDVVVVVEEDEVSKHHHSVEGIPRCYFVARILCQLMHGEVSEKAQ